MNVALIGATGFVGAALLEELLARGHQVRALARTPSKLAARAGLTVVQADVLDAAQVAKAVAGSDAVVSAFNPGWEHPDLYNQFLAGSKAIAEGAKQAGVKRLIAVGGAGSLFVAPGVQLVDTPEFKNHVPANVVPGAQAARDELTRLQKEEGALDWTFVSPAPMLAPGERTGRYQFGGDAVPMKDGQLAGITSADLAAAIVDVLEQGRYVRERFVAYS
ncbi:MAG: NAD(P)H-binding protein [Pseudacidovorax sp.]|uniref:NAD(P)-dependent oxidoreductase n=1 Tax=Pseudacidovorax sp. TaxID=1934311 RepID=UPI001B552FD9|nr:NAD(P)H-binding protein [Pseudacidovorax sp.]MBP6894126.1 NAD(P)H-binding protein [Pseudacidovorax sp.]